MSLRITSGMLYSRALLDIRNGLTDRLRLQEQVGSGRRVHRPSDDPAAMLRILPLRAELRDLEQLVDNGELAREILNTGAAALEDASSIMQRLREIAVQGANGTTSGSDRRSLGDEVDQLLQQMVGLANTRRGDRHLFGGTQTATAPFELVTAGGSTRVLYRGDRNVLGVEVAPGIRTTLNLPGDSIFMARDRGATTFSGGNTGAAPSGAADSGVGQGKLEITFAGLSIPGTVSGIAAGTGATTALGELTYSYVAGSPSTLSINGGPAVAIAGGAQDFPVGNDGATVSLAISEPIAPPSGTLVAEADLSVDGGASKVRVTSYGAGTEYQVKNSLDGTVLNVDVSGLVRVGTEQVHHAGTFDVFTTLVAVRDALRNDQGLPDQEVARRVGALLGEIDFAHDRVLDGVRDLGQRSQHMEFVKARVERLDLTGREGLSRLEDTDLAESILEMTQQDYTYQASLQVAARIMQTSLLNYLR
jgi:flagellar hook-associated protein 3 FlgL